MENLSYLFAAYTVVWIAIFGFILRLYRRQSQLRRDINSLKETLAQKRND